MSRWPYTEGDLKRRDESSDSDFYSQPRLVTHIDDAAIASLTTFYRCHFEAHVWPLLSVFDRFNLVVAGFWPEFEWI